ncbi:putative eka-like protein [Erysiphe neolycopersici]|uniref:Putative eka-like protein n=1 Tax=Erysiphe neolycopersici TaxID=212602 RepID=A0A420I3Y7_9PEZI|nr:putative eka-like protein [Erysiphe neolycopersici]
MKIDVPDSPSSSYSSVSNSDSFHSILQCPALTGPTQVPMANREPMDQDSPEAQKRKEVVWPSWSGTSESFGFYLARLKAKIEEDLNMLGPNRAICLSVIETLPETKQYLVGHWFERGGDDGKFRCEDLLNHFRDQFEDRELKMAACQSLTKMRQGSQQYFRDFLRKTGT